MSRREIPFARWTPVPDIDWAPDGATLSPVCRNVLGVFVGKWMLRMDEIRLGVPALVQQTGFSERAVISARQELVSRGLLRVINPGGRGRGSVATFALGDWASASKGAPDAPKDLSSGATSPARKGAASAPKGPVRVQPVQANSARKGARKGAQMRADREEDQSSSCASRRDEDLWGDISAPLPATARGAA